MAPIQPLVIGYSFNANRTQATDQIDLAQADLVLLQISEKLNEIIDAVNLVIRDDGTLEDGCFLPSHMSDDFRAEVVSIANAAADAQ